MGGPSGMMNRGQPPTQTGSPAAPQGTTRKAGGANGTDGRALFLASGCGGCHTLAAARTTGTAGPALDRARPGFELVVRRVTEGGGGMPSFAGSLTAAQIRAIARFVMAAAR